MLYWDNGKYNGNYYIIEGCIAVIYGLWLGLYWDDVKIKWKLLFRVYLDPKSM